MTPKQHSMLAEIDALVEVCLDKKQVEIVRMEAQDLIEQLQTAQRDLANADQDHEATEKHNRERAERAEEQFEALREASLRAAAQLPEDPQRALDTLATVLNPAEIRDSGLTLDFARGEVRKRDESTPASSPKEGT